MKQIIVFVIIAASTFTMSAQADVFTIDSFDTYSGCDAIMHDSNGGLMPYSPNSNHQITLFPGFGETQVNLYFIGFDIAIGDVLSIYDGPNTSSPLIGQYNQSTLLFETISPSASNLTGCLTVTFVSNSDMNVGDFSARLICGVPCDFPIADIDTAADTMKICPGESIEFYGGNSTWTPGAALAGWTWDFGDGTVNTNTWPLVEHVFNEPGGYRVRLSIEDSNGCGSAYIPQVVVLVSTPYIFDVTASDDYFCLGNSILLGTPAFSNSTENGFENETANGSSEAWIEDNSVVFDNGIYIPDNQGCLETQIVFNQFGNAVVDDISDLSSIYFNMEHSFVGDVIISLICPDGSVMSIFPEAGTSGTYLGEPIDADDGVPGIGYDYSFSPNSTGGTWVEFLSSTGGPTIPAGDYAPDGSWNNLIGCPLNGTWTLEVCDVVGADDGYVFEFGVQFAPSFYSDILQFTPTVDAGCAGSYWLNPELFSQIGPNCDWAVFEPSSAGVYTLQYEVVNDFGCVYNDQVTVTVAEPPVVSVNSINVCSDYPELNAFVENTIPGLTYAYSWSPSVGLSSPFTASPYITYLLNPTTYSVSVTPIGLANCESTAQALVYGESLQIATEDIVLCLGETASLNAEIINFDPFADYSYSWSPSTGLNNTTIASPLVFGLNGDETYTVTIIANNYNVCQGSAELNVVAIDCTTDIYGCTNSAACNYNPEATMNDGSCVVPGASCNDQNASTVNDIIQFNCLCEGTPIDPGCNGFDVTNSTVNPTCAGLANGSIAVNASGNCGPFNYSWSNGTTAPAINNLGPGIYTVEIIDFSGCTESISFNLTAPQAMNAVTSSSPVQCFGAATGSASVAVTGGTLPYSYIWNTSPIQFSASINAVTAGDYTVTISDANGCSINASATISQPTIPLAVDAVTTTATCSQNDGSATATVSGATGMIQYQWSNGQTTAQATNLAAGIYTISVTADGCSASTSISVNNTNAPIITMLSSSPACFGDATGTVNAIVNGGSSPYQYVWNNGNTNPSQNGLTAGSYTLIVIDNAGCQAIESVSLNQPNPISISITTTPTLCSGNPQGIATAIVSGGTTPYQYQWSNGSTESSISGLPIGTYSLTINDAAGCSQTSSATINSTTGISASANTGDVSCFGGSDGYIDILISSGAPPFTYNWSNGSTGENYLSGLEAGNYACTITDANGCTFTVTATINQPQDNLPDILGLNVVDPFSLQTYSISAISGASLTWVVTGGNILSGQGTNVIQVQWSNEPVATVTAIIFYANGCQAAVDLVVQIGTSVNEQIAQPSWTIFPNPVMDFLNVEVRNTQEFIPFVVHGSLGQSVCSGMLKPGNNTIDFARYSAGLYTLSIQTGNHSVQVQPFLKE
jgi:subtilisin-like proprotein convertase family protein